MGRYCMRAEAQVKLAETEDRLARSSSAQQLPATRRNALTPDAGFWPAVEQLRHALSANLSRVVELFREWDENGDGVIDQNEFRKAVYFVFWGVRVPPEHSNALFQLIDRDRSGTIDYRELNVLLSMLYETTHARLQRALA